jgi:RimJ/RimL family protein N-acetyltransferase
MSQPVLPKRDAALSSEALDPRFRSYLRLVQPDDAALICELRSDQTLNRHLSPSSPDVGAQRRWIEAYKLRETAGDEFYFVIVSENQDFGLVRMYDFRSAPDSFCWGSWVIRPSRPEGLVTFSALLIYELGFDVFGFAQSHFDVRKGNENVLAFHRRSGAIQTGEDERNFYFSFPREKFADFKQNSSSQWEAHRERARSGDATWRPLA